MRDISVNSFSITKKKNVIPSWYTVIYKGEQDCFNVCPLTHWIFSVDKKIVVIPRFMSIMEHSKKRSFIIENIFHSKIKDLMDRNHKGLSSAYKHKVCDECTKSKKDRVLNGNGNYCHFPRNRP